MEETHPTPAGEIGETPAPAALSPQDREAENEVDLNQLFPGEEKDLNALFPEMELKNLLKKISKNKKDLGLMIHRIAEGPAEEPEEPAPG